MSLTHGGDPQQMREVARQLVESGRRIGDCGQVIAHSAGVLDGGWQGPDSAYLLQAARDSQGRLDGAQQALIAFAARLVDQADQQDEASGARAGGAGAGTGGGPRPQDTGGPGGDARADNNDARDNRWWWDRKDEADYETDGDPGPDVEMPDGLDPDSQLARDLMATPSGREMLEWLRINDIEIRYDDGESGAWYDPGSNSITFGVDDPSLPEDERQYNDTPDTLIHEANHAQWDARDEGLEISHDDRDEYVQSQVDEEIEGQVDRWTWNEEARQEGIDVPVGADEQAWRDAYDAALAGGASQEEAAQAGHDEIELMFRGEHPSVNYSQSTDGQNYYDRHREDWDDRHDWWPWW
ncbi:hypothetical protein [Janibacter melonis]|uniref:hypothetical protein n=1 Tax=Janibacter melonis TaxID=262209 RepID=UPI0019198898|nr:hypothetical protein [Janibacter melonis]